MKQTSMFIVAAFLTFTLSVSASDRMVLGENFTNTGCGPCFYADPTLNYLAETYPDEISIIRYHVSWPSAGDPFYQYNPGHSTTRKNFYGVTGVPNFQIDGVDRGYSYNTWEAFFLQRLNAPSPLEIDITGTYDDQSRDVDINITVTATDQITQANLRIFCVLTESYIRFAAPNGTQTHNQTMREMFPNAVGEYFEIQNGETVGFEREFHVDEIIEEDYADIVVFAQSYTSKEVLQTTRVAVTNIPPMTGIVDFPQGRLPRTVMLAPNYPNPFNARTNIAFHLKEGCDVNLSVYNIIGEKVAELASGMFEAGSHIVSWDATGEASGVYFYRLKANGEIRTNRMVLMK